MVSNMTLIFSISYMGFHPSHFRTHISEGLKPPTIYIYIQYVIQDVLDYLLEFLKHSYAWRHGPFSQMIYILKDHFSIANQ